MRQILTISLFIAAVFVLVFVGNAHNGGHIDPGPPAITSVWPNPATGSASAQEFTIYGSNFVFDCNVTLRTGSSTYTNRPISSFSGMALTINPNFTTTTASWTVEVVNPDGRTSGEYTFTVNAPSSPAFGTLIGSFNEIPAYSNGSINNDSGDYNSDAGTNTGLKWQCVEYVNRYYYVHYGLNIRIPGQNANQYFPNASARGLIGIPNGSGMAVQVGDILCFEGGSAGHVAIVRDVSSSQITVIQQNVAQDNRDEYYTYSLSVSGGTYTVDGSRLGAAYYCQGWLRKSPTQPPSQPQTIGSLLMVARTFSFTMPTQAGVTYVTEFKVLLSDPGWTAFQTNTGNGNQMSFTDSVTAGMSRYYRSRVQ